MAYCIYMVKVTRDNNFPEWISVLVGNDLVEQFTSKRRAVKLAKKLAEDFPLDYFGTSKSRYILIDGKPSRI